MRLTGLHAPALVVAFALPAGCATAPSQPRIQPAVAAAAGASILQTSSPAAGATVAGPVNELILHFEPPARLDDVVVTGPHGSMPMMITAVGEAQHYSLPLSELGSGSYTVAWRASVRGRQYQGSFGFTVR